MSLVINIEEKTYEDETIKEVTASCGDTGCVLKEYYSYPTGTSDETIESEVEADLVAKGYPIPQ